MYYYLVYFFYLWTFDFFMSRTVGSILGSEKKCIFATGRVKCMPYLATARIRGVSLFLLHFGGVEAGEVHGYAVYLCFCSIWRIRSLKTVTSPVIGPYLATAQVRGVS